MAQKDFLSQFSENNKPASFKEEERIPVQGKNNKFNFKILIIVLACIALIAGIILFFVLRPTIEVESFVGKTKEDAVAWIRQQGIETSGVVFKEEYNFDDAKGIVILQEPESGKVRNNAKMTFTVSKGADPDEQIKVPDLSSMTRDEISAWIKENKLLSTKLNATYDDVVEADGFIKAEYAGCEEDTFTRGCTLKITVSKGTRPEDEIVMVDYVKKTFAEFEAWATPKKIKLNKIEQYSDTVEAGIIISQSVKEKEIVKSGDTVNVVVSKGKGIVVPLFDAMTNKEVDEWLSENASYVKVDKKYSEELGYVIEQSIKSGKYIDAENKLKITLNLGDYFYLDQIGFSFIGNSFDKFEDLAYELEEKGIYIDTHDTDRCSDEPRGTILELGNIWYGSKDDENNLSHRLSSVERLPLDVHVRCFVSTGPGYFTFDYGEFSSNPVKLSEFDKWIDNHEAFKLSYKKGELSREDIKELSDYNQSYIVSIKLNDIDVEFGDPLVKGSVYEIEYRASN